MLNFPETTVANRIIPKDAIYKHANVNTEIRQLFIEEIRRIKLANLLRKDTLNVEGGEYLEINVFEISLETFHLDRRVIETIDSAIPRPTIFVCTVPQSPLKKIICGYKTPDSGKVHQYFETDWSEDFLLKIRGITLDEIYKNFLSQIDPSFGTKSHKIADSFDDFSTIKKLKKQIELLNKKISREPQISKKQILAKQRAEIRQQIEKLK